jgi:hypothetical protein
MGAVLHSAVRVPDSLDDVARCGQPAGPGDLTWVDLSEVNCIDCKQLLDQRLTNLERVHRPIKAIGIAVRQPDGTRRTHFIYGDDFLRGSLAHNVEDGTVTLTFVNVISMETLYKDWAEDES